MLKFKEMTAAQMAEYIGGECCEELAAGVLSRCIEADYWHPHEVPEMHWQAFIECANRDMWRVSKEAA